MYTADRRGTRQMRGPLRKWPEVQAMLRDVMVRAAARDRAGCDAGYDNKPVASGGSEKCGLIVGPVRTLASR